MSLSFLSEVHVGQKSSPASTKGSFLTRFTFRSAHPHKECTPSFKVDGDGDLELPRSQTYTVVLEHSMSTSLEDVGHQVWRGALLMADFILSFKEIFKDSIVLELGSGVGMNAILVSQICNTVFCTDFKTSILDICQRNIARHMESIGGTENIVVKLLDWKSFFEEGSESHCWSAQDFQQLRKASIVIASDVIYDDTLTSAFFSCLMKLNSDMLDHLSAVYIALEKRVNFSLEELAPATPAYSYFRKCLDITYNVSDRCFFIEAVQIAIDDIPLWSNYDRVNEMEMWKLVVKSK